MAFIRLYQPKDFEACAQICIETLPPSLADSPEIPRLAPYLWTHPFTSLSPSTCHVLDDGTGKAVGYCIGCADIFAFASAWPSYRNTILSRDVTPPPQVETREPWLIPEGTVDNHEGKVNPIALTQLAYNAEWLLLEGREALASRWRATMHIDLLPPYQRHGWGRQLIEAFVESVRTSGMDYGDGEHIAVALDNSKVVPFYEKVGFRVIPADNDNGKSTTITLVRDIDGSQHNENLPRDGDQS